MKEYIHFDGEKDITFNVVHIDNDKQIAVIASTCEGKISVLEYEIKDTSANASARRNVRVSFGVICGCPPVPNIF